MTIKQELICLLHPYYWINLIVCLSYLVTKRCSLVCNLIFQHDDCELNGRETEILFFLISIVAIRSRRAGSISIADYLGASYTYARFANLALWWYADIRLGIGFGIILIILALTLPRPAIDYDEKIVYFQGEKELADEIDRDRRVVWIVAFYAAWHPACTTFAPVFSKLSTEFSLANLKFGKLDIGRYPEAAVRHRIVDSSLSKQLPTIILFQDGKEIVRRPQPNSKNQVVKFLFSEDNIKAAFDFIGLYKECQEQLEKRKSKSIKAKDE